VTKLVFPLELGLILILSLGATAAPRASAADMPTFTVTVASAFLRSEPRIQATATYSVFEGQVFPVIGRKSDNSWLQLDYPKATKGTWILASLGKITGDIGSVPVTAVRGVDSPTAAPTSSPAPTVEVEPTAIVTQAGPAEICALLYNDANGNGSRDVNEAALAGAHLAILDPGTSNVLKSYTTTASDTAGHCFRDLPVGAYTVAAAAPAGYNATTAGSIVQQVMAGSHYALVFGAQPRSSGPSSANTSGLALWGVLGIMLALLAAGVVGVVVRRRR